MSLLLIKCVFLVVWFVHLDGQDYEDRPKITTSNGHLILEAAEDKNIYLRVNGPKAGIFAQDINLLHLSLSDSTEGNQPIVSKNFDKYLNGPNGILSRLDRLEAASNKPTTLSPNTTYLMRRVNRLRTLIFSLKHDLLALATDECQSNPCSNGGTCLNLVNGHHCICPSNWEGVNCDVDVNECRNFAGTELGCQNGATCINKPGSYECSCITGWYGLHCTRRAKDCAAGNFEMCGYGTCVSTSSGEGIKCLCNQGWETNGTGLACLTDINECDSSRGIRCSSNPRVECINLPGSFRCGQCPPGYEGDGFTCRDIDECVTIVNGGCSPLVSCHNTIGSRICGPCPRGYQGDGVTCTWMGSCNINHGGCHPSAQCVESMSIVQCVCPLGMDGDGIGQHGCYIPVSGNLSRPCDNKPCGVNGKCHALMRGYVCLCNQGFTGVYCDSPIDYCSNNPCRNGGTCRSDDNSTGFRCECTAQYTGNLCQLRSKFCGGVLDAEDGSLVYPLNNNTYEHNSKCAWVIHTSPNKVLNVTFSKFHLELEPECRYDFLQIHDGRTSSSQLVGRFCGSDMPKGGHIISTHNYLYLWFRSDTTVAKDGFALHWNSIDPICGGEVDATTHGHIESPGSPGTYPANRDCYWHLTTTLGKRILLHFFALDIENHANCSFDYLEIYDGEHVSDPLISKYCNSTQPAPIQSASSEMLIHFHSDAFGSGHGFQITYAPIEGIPSCGGYYTLNKGEIVSPSYDGTYLNNLLCEYKITTNRESTIRLTFINFKLEKSLRCRYDYLKVYDGPSSNSKLVGKFCGNTYPKTFVSSTNNLFIIFKSDHSSVAEGFKISFESICAKRLFGDSGIIKSPGYPLRYAANEVCEYIIRTTPGKAIQISFQDFDIEDNRYFNCNYDGVEIRDGADRNATLLGRFCGGIEHTPPVQTSTHNYMYIRFYSDLSVSGTGFYANYTVIDTECGGIYREQTGLIQYPEKDTTYRNVQNCTWMLIAPEGERIKLNWNRFDIEKMPSCNSDYVELIEVEPNNKKDSLGTFCGTSPPPSLTTTTNRLIIRFKSDASVISSGFSMSYTFLNDKTHCGAIFVKSHGFIYSPGWPKRYEPNHDCTWTITVPVGQQIKLNISQFDIERPIRDKCDMGDYLEIRNGGSSNSPLIGKYCGSFTYKQIISHSNKLYLHFHSDYYLSGNGFKIEWDGTITGCGGTLTSSSGSISSPNYPDGYYENAECYYKIITSQGSKLQLRFSDIELERTLTCRDDFVEIFDGPDENSRSLGSYCYMKPNLNAIDSSTNIVYVKFRSDAYIGGKGFILNYETICENNITGRYGVIESPDYPGNYRLQLNCLWTITVPKGNKINVTFSHFDVYKSLRQSNLRYRTRWIPFNDILTGCDFDYFQWKETSQSAFSTKFCGSDTPQIKATNSNSIQIKFHSGPIMPRTGFRLEWVSYGCGGYIHKRYGSFSLNKEVASQKMLECEWIIESPLGTSLTITFDSVHMASSSNCEKDYIEIHNGPTVESPLITRFCERSPTLIQSTSNLMLIRFTKNSDLKDVYFFSNFHSWRSSCGATLMSPSGIISSQNYPKNYDNNIDCLWIITIAQNHRIELNFIDLDLYSENSVFDDTSSCGDSIKIFDGPDTVRSNYSQIVCPSSQVKQIISKTNILSLQFVTDDHGTAKGFRANFSITCGANINATHEGIISNNDLVKHTNKSCTWTVINPNLEQKISLTITYISISTNLNTNTNTSCPLSFLRIHDGRDENSPVIGEYCGRKSPPTIISNGNSITVEFGTYTNMLEGRFSVHYSPLNNACGGSLGSEEGTIASPNYPYPYPINIDCEWRLKTSPGNKVYIVFESFDVQYSDGCNQDYLEVRQDHSGGPLLGVYCGNNIPINTTTASLLYIKFHSDNKDSGKGFVINYGFEHGNDIWGSDSGEVASPLYPFPYEGSAEYSWRITISSGSITLHVSKLEIVSYGEVCSSYLAIYDGYDEEASLIETLCGILDNNYKTIQTSSNVVYLKLHLSESNTGSLFLIRWSNKLNDDQETTEQLLYNCGVNTTQSVRPGDTSVFNSPNYPQNYNNSLNCSWIFKTTEGRHLKLRFIDFKIEDTSSCFADSVSVYSADVPDQWRLIKSKICVFEDASNVINGSTYLKVLFTTDSTITKKGFLANVESLCGGFLSDASGVISPSWSDWDQSRKINIQCDWTVRVKPGRVIKLTFLQFNITNSDECSTYIVLRNGESVDSPMLSHGKYCGYSHENRSGLITSSNALYVSYYTINSLRHFNTFKLYYEEKGTECGTTSLLSTDHSWEIISSPNYPSIPSPYDECVWKFTGPPGEIIRFDFVGIDLDKDLDCNLEYIEVRDGYSELSPLKEKICGNQNPGTIKTSSNTLYVKYFTQKPIPNNGFKANITLDVCGGTIFANLGEITSPGYPHWPVLKYGSVCEWHIKGNALFTFAIQAQDINLPHSEASCGTKLTIEEPFQDNSSEVILKTFCSDDYFFKTDHSLIQTLTNSVIIKLYIGKPSNYYDNSQLRGFRLTFNSSVPQCGGSMNTPEGFLTTPGYPRDTTLRSCYWKISSPDKSRRITLELIDADIQRHKISIYNDLSYRVLIQKIPSDDFSPTTTTFESSGNVMTVYIWLDPRSGSHHRFKAKFRSDKPAYCGGDLSGVSGSFVSPLLDRSYACIWSYHYDFKGNALYMNSSEPQLNTLLVKVNVNTSKTNFNTNLCKYSDPLLNIKSVISKRGIRFSRALCESTQSVIRIPSSVVEFTAIKRKNRSLYFNVEWKLQPCGGVIYASENSTNILNVDNTHNDSIDCAWIVVVPFNKKVEFILDGVFDLKCDEEFVTVNPNVLSSSTPLGEYCKDKMLDAPIILRYSSLYIQYHTKPKLKNNLKINVKTIQNQCGGYILTYENLFESPNYPKNYMNNQECTWEIKTDIGSRISLKFVGRFAIEDRPNCTKDAVIIQDWKDDSYVEVARLCGRIPPPEYNSTFNKMKVIFRTDSEIVLDGFQAMWTRICGGKYNATNVKQYLYSPKYPLGYDGNLKCEYEISAENQPVVVEFITFDLEGSPPDCSSDNLTISAFEYNDLFYGVFCGKDTPPKLVYDSFTLTFKTDMYIDARGFQVSYMIDSCGGEITEPTEINSNIDYYKTNLNCTWRIIAPTNKSIVIRFRYFDLESSTDCSNDYLAIYEGLTVDIDKRLNLMCGRDDNSTALIKSSNNTMLLNLVTDSSVSGLGFKADIYFTYSALVGCGGSVVLSSDSTFNLKSPLIGSSSVYENFLDCHWTVFAPVDNVVTIKFTSFHVAPCQGVNQTALGLSNCNCDYLEIRDGSSPNSDIIHTFCGHTLPPNLFSSSNVLSIILHTDGDVNSSGFEATLSYQPAICGQSTYKVSKDIQVIKWPNSNSGSISGKVTCLYNILINPTFSSGIHLMIKKLDLLPGSPDQNICNLDKITVIKFTKPSNVSVGKDLITNMDDELFTINDSLFEQSINNPKTLVFCGSNKNIDLYFSGSVSVTFQLSPQLETDKQRGFELELVFANYCGKNYTEPYGRITTVDEFGSSEILSDCYTLITAPENHTVSAYFLRIAPTIWYEELYLEIHDGNETTSPSLKKVGASYYDTLAVFSSSRYMLIHNHVHSDGFIGYDLTYVTSAKSSGCGGILHSQVGRVTSPMFPDIYRKKITCEWELETPSQTRLLLRFSVFDLSNVCDQVYLQLVNRKGETISTFCSETPADYTSVDNYVKIVFVNSMNNGGTGWVAEFIGIV